MDDEVRQAVERKAVSMARTIRADFRRDVKQVFKRHIAEATLADDEITAAALKNIQRDIVALVGDDE